MCCWPPAPSTVATRPLTCVPPTVAPISRVQEPEQFTPNVPVTRTSTLPACASVTSTGLRIGVPVVGVTVLFTPPTPPEDGPESPLSPFATATPCGPCAPVSPFGPGAPVAPARPALESWLRTDFSSFDCVTAPERICWLPTLLRGSLAAA